MLMHTRQLVARVPSSMSLAAAFTPRVGSSPFFKTVVSTSPSLLVARGSLPLLLNVRDFHSKKFSRNVEFFTASDASLPKNTMEVASSLSSEERPLALLFCWLMAKERHVKKYAQLYTNMGIDVLKVRISPFDLLRPTKGSQIAAEQVLNFLHANPSYGSLMVHGLSVGAYLFMEVLGKIDKDMEKHGHLLNRFVGQIWDSAVDMYGIPDGVPRAITNNISLQRNIKKYLLWYLRAHYNTATIHYEQASTKMHENFVGVPGLFFFSDNDPVSSPEMNAMVYKKWEAKNIPVYTRCWKDSPHVSHYLNYRKEYEEEVVAFLERIGLIESTRQRASSI